MTDQLVPVQASTPQVIDRGMMPLAEVVGRVRRIQEVMTALMKEGTHFGTIPGTPKPTLYQPGAELLCSTFRIAPEPKVEDLSTPETVRYRVTMRGVLQTTGELLGEGVGECSSDEEKYRWRRPVCDEEFAESPEDRKREKWMRGKDGNFKAKQIRMSPADIANTVLKMAYKRALISMARVTLACSDIFAQDLEDLPAEVRDAVLDAEHQDAPTKPPIQPPKAKNGNGVKTGQVIGNPETDPKALRVRGVEERHSKPDAEKPWTLYIVTFSDGREATTFDKKIAELAAALRDEQVPVEAAIEAQKDKPGKFKLTELSKVLL